MRTCYRCGVDFDGTGLIADAPCFDCQEQVEGFWVWATGTRDAGTIEKRKAIIIRLHARKMTDPEIAEYCAISPMTVLRWRQKLALKANPQKDWNDATAVREAIMERNNAAWRDPKSGLRNRKKRSATRRGLLSDKREAGWNF